MIDSVYLVFGIVGMCAVIACWITLAIEHFVWERSKSSDEE